MVYLAAHLKEGGFRYIDTQFYSEHLRQFGTKKINKEKYLDILTKYGKTDSCFPVQIKKNVLEYFK